MIRAFAALGLIGALAGCAGAPSAGVTLAQAQAESGAIVAALTAGEQIYATSPATPPAEAAKAQEVLAVAQQANESVQALVAGDSLSAEMNALTVAVEDTLAVTPLDMATRIAIDAGMAVLDTFIAEQPATPALTARMPGAGRVPIVAAPVPIPLPRPNAAREF